MCFVFSLLKKLRWQCVTCNIGHHCYNFEYEIKSGLSQQQKLRTRLINYFQFKVKKTDNSQTKDSLLDLFHDTDPHHNDYISVYIYIYVVQRTIVRNV